jgi:HPt (histidine-containing phosphotransfer) domain-containing protein
MIAGQNPNGALVWSLTADLSEIATSDAGMLLELVSLFIDDSTVRLQTLNSACCRQDFKVVRAQAHSLKGSALQMGAARLAFFCAALESADRPEPDRCGPMMRAIDDEFALVRLAMEEYLVNAETAQLQPNRQHPHDGALRDTSLIPEHRISTYPS